VLVYPDLVIESGACVCVHADVVCLRQVQGLLQHPQIALDEQDEQGYHLSAAACNTEVTRSKFDYAALCTIHNTA